MLTKAIRCKSCDCILWSNYAKAIEICPECEVEDEELLDIEDELEKLLK